MGINFPNSPAVGDLWPIPAVAGLPVYQWDGEKWVTGPPASPDGIVHYDRAQSLTSPQLIQARQNIYAAPFDAMSYNGIQVNGNCDISQERGTANFAIPNGVAYILDGWIVFRQHATAVFNSGQITPAGFGASIPVGGYSNIVYAQSATAMATLANNDCLYFGQRIEGYRMARLAWGTSLAQPLSYGFWIYTPRAGGINLWITNSAVDRSYVAEKTVIAGWNWVTGTIPGDTTGTWLKDNGLGMYFLIFLSGFSTSNVATPNAWQAGSKWYTANQTNQYLTNGNSCGITGLILLPGLEVPSQDRAPFIMRQRDQELPLCKRYWHRTDWHLYIGAASGAQVYQAQNIALPPMRAVPTGTNAVSSNTNWSSITAVVNNVSTMEGGPIAFVWGYTSAAGYSEANGYLTLDARF